MNKKIAILQGCYWLGIVLDAVAAVKLSILRYIEIPNVINTQNIGIFGEGMYAAGESVALMWGWTCLLFWASRRPVERKGVLLLTIFPVVIGLMVNTINYAMNSSVQNFEVTKIIGEIVLIGIFGLGYFLARDKSLKSPT